jgi:hypothetical protein
LGGGEGGACGAHQIVLSRSVLCGVARSCWGVELGGGIDRWAAEWGVPRLGGGDKFEGLAAIRIRGTVGRWVIVIRKERQAPNGSGGEL